jgi:hypothetical protein
MKTVIRLAIAALVLPAFHLSAATHFVSLGSTNPTPPYTDWATAATNIQQAVDAASAGDMVLVTNGVYALGVRKTPNTNGLGFWFNRVAITNAMTLQSLNGPQVTIIDGGGTNRCVSLADGVSLTGFTMTNGGGNYGSGVWCSSSNAFLTNCLIAGNYDFKGAVGGSLCDCTVSGNFNGGAEGCTLYNCTLMWNSANYTNGGGASGCRLYYCMLTGNSASFGDGGGVNESVLYNCTLSRNTATAGYGYSSGGGAAYSTLYNCTLTGNWSSAGGGAFESTLYNCSLVNNSAVTNPMFGYGGEGGGACGCKLYNCIVYFNAGLRGANYDYSDDNPSTTSSTLNSCCTTPLPSPLQGVGDITNAPLFVNYDLANLRLQSNSPCINAGNNTYVTAPTDLDGNARIVSGTVDIGAYEYQGAGSRISYAWLQQYGLPIDGSADYADPDLDGMNNWQEWVCGTDPTNSQSVLRMIAPHVSSGGVTVAWRSAPVHYFIERSTTLDSPFTLIATNIPGATTTTGYTDTNAVGPGPFFYRVGVNSP